MLKKSKITVTVPHRISGFFEIVDKTDQGEKITNPEKIGSRGAGFNLNAVGKTEIIIEKCNQDSKPDCRVYINSEEVNQKAETTYFIYNAIKNSIKKRINIKIFHNFELPVGCGYGASGSGALGTIFGLDSLLKLKLSYYQKGKIAHVAEVINKTGLGTVCGQLSGGLCILKEAGHPCVSEQITVPEDLIVVCGTFGAIPTKSIITSDDFINKIKTAGRRAMLRVLADKNVKTFMRASIDFVKET
ncbi:MAG: hypothetical protein GF353_27110, partial [Candidatus Lokiarchaeota archaeon]|nr:hypothetical protein [Candidatus Lokiarchaeota archaeon]